jgi:hypothetical protein
MGRPSLAAPVILGALLIGTVGSAFAAGGKPFEDTAAADESQPEGAVWDLSKPLWIFFAQERLLAPRTPLGEAIPRAAFAHVRPVGEEARAFFILAGIAYLGLFHTEKDSLELEASLFSMLVPVGSALYRDGHEVDSEEIETAWTDASVRARKTWGPEEDLRARLGLEYQLASRRYEPGEEIDPAFVLPADTLVHEMDAVFHLDTRRRGLTGDYDRGFELELGFARELRSDWSAWGPTGTEYADPDAESATTAFGSFEWHAALDARRLFVLHGKLRGARGWDLDRLTYIRLGGGGFGRQFDRVGAGSTGAANDGELFRMDGVPGHYGGEFMTDRYAQVNLELDVPTGTMSRAHVSAAYARLRDVLSAGKPWEELLGFGLGFTRIHEWRSAVRIDLGYSPRPDGAFDDAADVTLTYIRRF